MLFVLLIYSCFFVTWIILALKNESPTMLSDRLSGKWAWWRGRALGAGDWFLQRSKRGWVERGQGEDEEGSKYSWAGQPPGAYNSLLDWFFFSPVCEFTLSLCEMEESWQLGKMIEGVYTLSLIRSALVLLPAKLTSVPAVLCEVFRDRYCLGTHFCGHGG